MNWHVYCFRSIDSGWAYLLTVAEVAERLEGDDQGVFLSDWEAAKDEAEQRNWEVDLQQTPRVFFLPSQPEFLYGFVFKEDNGLTFVLSPKPLGYLEGPAD